MLSFTVIEKLKHKEAVISIAFSQGYLLMG
jgi:hypothetical protein